MAGGGLYDPGPELRMGESWRSRAKTIYGMEKKNPTGSIVV